MLENTKLFFLKEDIFKEFGIEEGEKLYQNVEKIYNELISSANYRESEAIKHHLITNLFPTMAYYKALLDNGYNIDTALSYVRKETKKSAGMKRIENQKMSKMPFTYLMYRLAVKGVMKKNFPDEGFETEWIRCDKTEIHFDLHRCIYNDLTKEYEFPELCTVFCENDDIAFNGLMPKIRFERNGTLGQGMNKCDFHLINNRKKNR